MILRPLTLPILVLALILAVVPAAATRVNVKYAAADYAAWTTWRFVENPQQKKALEKADRTAIRAIVRSAIAERLEKAGYAPAAAGEKADFQVAIDGSMRDVFDVRDYHKQIAEHVAFVMEGGSSSYREGTLMIRILHGDDVVWTGWVTEQIEDPEKSEKQIRKAVKKILRRFPPRER